MLKTAFIAPLLLVTITVASAQEPTASAAGTAAAVTATGTLKIQMALKASSALPSGTTLSVNIGAYSLDQNYSNSSYLYPSTTVQSGKATLSASVPYKWMLTDRKGMIYVTVYVSGFSSGGVFDTSSFTQNIAVPANGTVTTVRVSGTI